MSKFQNKSHKTKQTNKKHIPKQKIKKMVHKRQQISLNSPLISNGGSIELFTKDGISVFYTLDKLPLNRLGYRAHFFCIDNDYEYTPFCHGFSFLFILFYFHMINYIYLHFFYLHSLILFYFIYYLLKFIFKCDKEN